MVKKETGANVEVLLLERNGSQNIWKALVKPGSKIKKGNILLFPDNIVCEVLEHLEDGTRILEFKDSNFYSKIYKIGQIPLPPYIKKHLDDPNQYQTEYAKYEGAVAAPTAGLHFTQDLLEELQGKKWSKYSRNYFTCRFGNFQASKRKRYKAI